MQKREPHVQIGRESLQSSYRPRPTPSHPAKLAETEMRAAGGSARVTLKKAPRQTKNTASSSSRIQQWITWTIGGCAAVLGFIGVLWLTGPATAPPNPAIMILTNAAVSDATSLMAAVQTAGLRGAHVLGELVRLPSSELDHAAGPGRHLCRARIAP